MLNMADKDVQEVRKILEDIRKNNLKSKEVEFVKKLDGNYFVRVPKITRQFLGFGKGKKRAFNDAENSLEEIERRWS